MEAVAKAGVVTGGMEVAVRAMVARVVAVMATVALVAVARGLVKVVVVMVQ